MLKLAILGLCIAATLASEVDREFLDGASDEVIRELFNQHMEAYNAQPKHNDPVPLMIAKEGYPVETHTVITDDGYILEMHRIPFGKKSPPSPGVIRPAVYLQHGLLCSSADFVMGCPEKSLGYILADNGYDVWMGNFRGNTYSRSHVSLSPNNNAFWDFSWDEMGEYDIPAMVDKILFHTGHSKIHYVGHSMGTTAFMVMTNLRPEYRDKIYMANFMAPVAYVEHMRSPIRVISLFTDEVEWITDFLGLGEFLPSNALMNILAEVFCDEGFLQGICESVLFMLCGFDEAQLNDTLLKTIIQHTPAGASTHTIIHYGQEVSGGFHAYDHGKKDNVEHYGTETPPEYDLSMVTVPVSLYWGQNDWFCAAEDLLELLTHLPNLYDNWEVDFEQWNHLDFLWGIDADTLVYPRVLENMARIEKEYNP